MQGVITKLEDGILDIELPNSISQWDLSIDQKSIRLAEPGHKTSADYAWRQEVWESESFYEVDTMFNKEWYESTIIDKRLHEQKASGRKVMYVKIGYRVYRENPRQYYVDEYGKYEGYGS